MRRVSVYNAFQVLLFFYLFVTCFCSSLNVAANVKGVLPSDSSTNDSVPASHVNSKDSVEKEIPSEPQIVANDPPPKVTESEKKQEPVQSSQAQLDNAADIKPVAEPAEAPVKIEAENNSTLVANVEAAPPPSSSDGPGVKNESVGAPIPGASEEKSSATDPALVGVPETLDTPQKAAKPPEDTAEAENVTKRDGERETPEDGSDVPTFGEYQRKFTSGGNPAKEGSNVKASVPGDGETGSEGLAAKTETSGGAQATGGAGSVSGGASRQGQSFKNIGSHNCGAKVISHNNEASNPAYVLNENRDEYMNNPCAVKKWIVVETCEPVRLRKIEMASYELFSSMVKTFRVSSSERFPQKMWDVVGTFVAKNEKGVQTYATEQEKYYKYFKFEFVDHYGSEHFCPVSLIRLFGVLMEDDDDDDDAASSHAVGAGEDEAAAMVRVGKNKEPVSRSLLQSAKEVIVGIVQNTLRPATSIDGSAESALTGAAAVGNTVADLPTIEPRAAVEGARVVHLMRLLLSGDYSGLLQRCLELLRRAPPVVQRSLVEHSFVPSPSAAFAACAKAAAQSKISAEELRWAYLAFNNASFPWQEPEKGEEVEPVLREVPPVENRTEKREEAAKEAPEPVMIKTPEPSEAAKSSGATPDQTLPPPPVSLQPPPPPPPKPVEAPQVVEIHRNKVEIPDEVPKAAENEQPKVPKENEQEPKEKLLPTEKEQEPKELPKELPKEIEQPKEKELPKENEVPEEKQLLKEKELPKEIELPKEKEAPKEIPKEKELPKENEVPKELPKEKEQPKEKEVQGKQKTSGEASNGRGVGLKESAYMRLSNKVKDMERNITISMGYLDELSRSYVKKTDKLSKQLEKTMGGQEELRVKLERQELRIVELEAQIKTLRETYEAKGLVELRRENARLTKDMLVHVLALNFIVILLHCLMLFFCWRRCRRPVVVPSNGAAGSPHTKRFSLDALQDAKEEPFRLSHSNSDSNLCIVDPPFRFDSNFAKKYHSVPSTSLSLDSKKRKRKKRSNAGVNAMSDRSASVSRIEQLIM